MITLILSSAAILALGVGSVSAQNANPAAATAKPPAANSNAQATSGGSFVTPSGVRVGGTTKKASVKKQTRNTRRRTRKS